MKIFANNTGFTLIELLVGTVVLSLLIISLTALYFTVDATQQRSQRLSAATRAGELKIESLRNQHYNSLQDGETRDFTDELPPVIPEPREATAEISAPDPDLRHVRTTITYEHRGVEQRVVLSSLIGNIGISQ